MPAFVVLLSLTFLSSCLWRSSEQRRLVPGVRFPPQSQSLKTGNFHEQAFFVRPGYNGTELVLSLMLMMCGHTSKHPLLSTNRRVSGSVPTCLKSFQRHRWRRARLLTVIQVIQKQMYSVHKTSKNRPRQAAATHQLHKMKKKLEK